MVCPGGADLEVCDLGSALGLPKWCRLCPIMVSPSGVDLEVYGLGLALRPANMVLLPAQLHCDEFLGLETIDAALSVSMNDYRRRRHHRCMRPQTSHVVGAGCSGVAAETDMGQVRP